MELGFPSKQFALFTNLDEIKKKQAKKVPEIQELNVYTSSFSIMSLILIPGNPTEALTKLSHSVLRVSDVTVSLLN